MEAGIETRWREVKDALVKRGIALPQVIFDFGPSRPWTEAWCMERDWPGVPIIGVEPSAINCAKIEDIYPGVLLNAAVSDHVGELTGFVNKIDFRIVLENVERVPYSSSTVPCITVDALDAQRGPFDRVFIWADIEGAELAMLRGAKRMLLEKKIVGLNIEIWAKQPVPDWPSWDETVAFLAEYGYAPVEERQSDNCDYLFLPV